MFNSLQFCLYLNDHEALWITSHAGKLGDQLTELGSALRVDHPAWEEQYNVHEWHYNPLNRGVSKDRWARQVYI